MLHSAANASKHLAFARVPSIFGAIGGNQSETSYFQRLWKKCFDSSSFHCYSTEVGDVAFIQITVEIATVASLQDGTVEYEMISQYFRETMLNELECKLQVERNGIHIKFVSRERSCIEGRSVPGLFCT